MDFIDDGVTLVGNEIEYDLGDFFRVHEVLLFDVGAHFLDQVGVDTAGAEDVNADIVGFEFFGHGDRHATEGVFGGPVGYLVGVSFDSHNRRYIDDITWLSLAQQGGEIAAEDESGAGIYGHAAVPVLIGGLFEGAGDGNAGVIDEDVEAIEFGFDGFYQVVDGLFVPQIGGNAVSLAFGF